MFKFNNNHIFTGYLKQLLASFPLPKCRVYTQELEQQQLNYKANKNTIQTAINNLNATQQDLKASIEELTEIVAVSTGETKAAFSEILSLYQEDYEAIPMRIKELTNKLLTCTPKIIPTNYHSEYYVYPNTLPEDLQLSLTYPSKMRYNPYIKDGYLQVFADDTWHNCHYSFKNSPQHSAAHQNTKTPYARIQYTYGQPILNYTKTLQIQNTVYDSYTHEYLGEYLRFHRDFANINLMPFYNCFSNRACPHLDLKFTVKNGYEVKFKTEQLFETTLYKYYMVPVKFFKNYTIAMDSETSIEVCCCVYDTYLNKDNDFKDVPKLTYQCFGDLQFKTPVLYTKLQNLNELLVEPSKATNDLCQQEDNLKLILKVPVTNKSSIVILEGDYTTYNDRVVVSDTKGVSLVAPNKTVINYENLDACELLANKLITPLQLLRTNTGESYPFADRLVEYLVGNAITVNEEIKDNVVRAKTVISKNCNPEIYPMMADNGIWEPILQCLTYDYINEKKNLHDINHDILGFIDKDVEKWYAATNGDSIETIANVDIYT